MKINKKEDKNKFNSILGNIPEGTIVALEGMDDNDGVDDNYWLVNDFDSCEYPFAELDDDFDSILITNVITGFATFVPMDEKCKILNFELKEL